MTEEEFTELLQELETRATMAYIMSKIVGLGDTDIETREGFVAAENKVIAAFAKLRLLLATARDEREILRKATRDLLDGYELDYSGCDVRYTLSPDEWDGRIAAAKAAVAAMGEKP